MLIDFLESLEEEVPLTWRERRALEVLRTSPTIACYGTPRFPIPYDELESGSFQEDDEFDTRQARLDELENVVKKLEGELRKARNELLQANADLRRSEASRLLLLEARRTTDALMKTLFQALEQGQAQYEEVCELNADWQREYEQKYRPALEIAKAVRESGFEQLITRLGRAKVSE